MYLGEDLPQRLDCARNAGDLFALSKESLGSSTDQFLEELALEQLAEWDEAKRLGLETYSSSPNGTRWWDEYISATYRCLAALAPRLDSLPLQIKDRVQSDLIPVAVDRVSLCSLEERVGFIETLASSKFLAELPVPSITAELLPTERVGDFVVRRVFCTHSIDQTFGNDLSLLARGFAHLQQLFDEFQPSIAVSSMFESCLVRFGQIKFRQWNEADKRLDDSQLRLLRGFCSLSEQLGQLDDFLIRTSDSLLGLFEKLDPNGASLVRDPELNSLLLSIHRVRKEPINPFLSRTMNIRAKLLLLAPPNQDAVSRLAELRLAVRAGALDSSYAKDIHQLLTETSTELPKHSLVTYRDWLVLAATTKFEERSALATAIFEMNALPSKLADSLNDEEPRKLVVDCCRAFVLLRDTLVALNLQNSLRTSVSSLANVLRRTSLPFDQRDLYQILPLFITELNSFNLPFSEETLKRLTPQDQTTHTDGVVNILYSLASRFPIPPTVTLAWFQRGFCQRSHLKQLSDRSITRLLIVAEPHLTSDSPLLAEAFYRCFADTGKEKSPQLLRRTGLAHAHLGVQVIPQALRMVAEIIQNDPVSVTPELAHEKIPVLFSLLWWTHTSSRDPELVSDGCRWIEATGMRDAVRWSSRDHERWRSIQDSRKTESSSSPAL